MNDPPGCHYGVTLQSLSANIAVSHALRFHAGGLGLHGALDQQAIAVAALGGSGDFVVR